MTRGFKHGLKGTPEYNTWVNLRARCNNPQGHDAYYYEGITVCPEWGDVTRFIADMGPRPGKHYEIDRIDTTKGYSKENCRWVDKKTQMQNTRISKWWWLFGLRHNSLSDAATAHNTTSSRIRVWCEGRTDGGYTYPPKPGCWSEKKYAE